MSLPSTGITGLRLPRLAGQFCLVLHFHSLHEKQKIPNRVSHKLFQKLHIQRYIAISTEYVKFSDDGECYVWRKVDVEGGRQTLMAGVARQPPESLFLMDFCNSSR